MLYGEVYRADATPTAAQVEATKTVEQDAATVIKQWDAFKSTDLTNLNNTLRDAGLPEVHVEATSPGMGQQGDEE
jgi:hypothetical protein